MRPLLVIAILVSSLQLSAQVPAQTPPAKPGQTPARDTPARDTPAATAVIRGQVLSVETGKPLGKATVRATGAELKEGRSVRTDADGRYEIKELPAGRFQLTASKAGYVPLQYGQRRTNEGGKPLDIQAGQVADKVDFSLPRGAVITGRVIDELGDPAVEISVTAMRSQYANGRRRLMPVGRAAITNDIGEYRLYGLMPGSYYISASARESIFDALATGNPAAAAAAMGGGDQAKTGYAATYYPGTDRVADAQRVTVTSGQTIGEIQIPLSLTRNARITGFVRDSAGQMVTSGAVIAMLKDMPLSPMVTQLQPDGSFTINNVSPGDYMVLSATGNPMAGGDISFASVSVTGEDIAGLMLNAVKPITVRGRIQPMSSPARPLPIADMRVSTAATTPDMPFVGSPMPVKINDDQTFEMKAWPGRALFRVAGATGWEILSVKLHGEDLTDNGIEFVAEEDMSGLEVELTNQPSALTGTVSDGGRASRDYTVVAFSQDPERWTPTSRRIRVGRPDQDGKFRINVPPGDYYVAAIDALESGEEFDPDFLNKLRDVAGRFTLNLGEQKPLDLKRIPHP